MKKLLSRVNAHDDRDAVKEAIRLAIAAIVLQSLRTLPTSGGRESIAREAVMQADALLKELES